uniref:ORF38 n=1 Tax=Nitrosopumilaceae spindle-shaped virus TaxID=3065433 RepID=A0AAT9J7D8_9VIRU
MTTNPRSKCKIKECNGTNQVRGFCGLNHEQAWKEGKRKDGLYYDN